LKTSLPQMMKGKDREFRDEGRQVTKKEIKDGTANEEWTTLTNLGKS